MSVRKRDTYGTAESRQLAPITTAHAMQWHNRYDTIERYGTHVQPVRGRGVRWLHGIYRSMLDQSLDRRKRDLINTGRLGVAARITICLFHLSNLRLRPRCSVIGAQHRSQ